MAREILGEGRFTRLVRERGWEYVERTNTSGIVIVIALTAAGELLLIEQHRPPVGARVVELPAGLAGDIAGEEDEALATAAERELLEETGYVARDLRRLTEGPLSAGLTTEIVTVFGTRGAVKVGAGGGDHTEDIAVFPVPLADVPAWLEARVAAGSMVDPKVYAALWFAERLAAAP
ncbi:MAG: DNA mismatch repair protein MutT [Deltaproteobacteria bacterium HGW-Deltaproteobacteria-14]|jgi:ADP-ribose pyrophosphatase|nr:MAG: DNA mismatch repair protein MutT [Deltaproteobacteria bacterium HGW-Deltaproteobacteria-14]